MSGQRYASHLRRSSLAALACALRAAGCSGEGESAAAEAPAPPPAATATTADRTQLVYDAYFRHCKQFTWQALVYPRAARDETDAARQYAGPPRQYQRPAFRGCLAGLRADAATVDLETIKRLSKQAAKEHGLD